MDGHFVSMLRAVVMVVVTTLLDLMLTLKTKQTQSIETQSSSTLSRRCRCSQHSIECLALLLIEIKYITTTVSLCVYALADKHSSRSLQDVGTRGEDHKEGER